MDSTVILFVVIALLATQAILSDIADAVPHVLHSLPFKLIGIYAILYGATKSSVSALQGILVFAMLVFVMVLLESAIVQTTDPYTALEKALA